MTNDPDLRREPWMDMELASKGYRPLTDDEVRGYWRRRRVELEDPELQAAERAVEAALVAQADAAIECARRVHAAQRDRDAARNRLAERLGL